MSDTGFRFFLIRLVNQPSPPPHHSDLRIGFYKFWQLFKAMGTRRDLYLIQHRYTDNSDAVSAKGLHAFLQIEHMVRSRGV